MDAQRPCLSSACRPRNTKPHAPGPGPSRRQDWTNIAEKHLQGRNLILHTDGAHAYRLKLPSLLHNNVAHKETGVVVKGIRLFGQSLISQKISSTTYVNFGAQVIDRFWGHLRACLKHAPRRFGSAALKRKIRAAQWIYWHKNQNALQATASMLKELRRDASHPRPKNILHVLC